jgi:hypothetical protein
LRIGVADPFELKILKLAQGLMTDALRIAPEVPIRNARHDLLPYGRIAA